MGMRDSEKAHIDHEDRNPLNNHKNNLRFCTYSENSRNRGKPTTNTSGYKGVSWFKRDKKWKAQIMVEGKGFCLGSFKNKIDAARAYNRAALKYHGEFACLNEI